MLGGTLKSQGFYLLLPLFIDTIWGAMLSVAV